MIRPVYALLLTVCGLVPTLAQQTDFGDGAPVLRSIDPTPTPSPTPAPTPRAPEGRLNPPSAAPPAVVLPPSASRTVPQAFDPIQHVYLNPDAVCLVPCQTNMVTTVQFPEPVQIMDGKGFARSPEESKSKGALFFLSHVPNSNILSVNPLVENVASNLNVVMDGDVYVLVFVAQARGGAYKVKLQQRPPPPGPPPNVYGQKRNLAPSPEQLVDTITLCKGYALFKDQHPELVDDFVTVYPNTSTEGNGFTIRNLGIYRKDRFDALVFECQLVNNTDQIVYYDPKSFAIRVGPSLLYHVTIPDASGEIPPHGKASAWFLFQGDDYGGSANLDPRNDFHLSLKRTDGPVAKPEPPQAAAAEPSGAAPLPESAVGALGASLLPPLPGKKQPVDLRNALSEAR